MVKFHPYPRRVLRRRRRAWIRQNKKLISVAVAGALGLIVVETIILLALPASVAEPFRWYLMGGFHVGIVVGLLGMLQALFIGYDREAINHTRGAWGEENTRSELARARRKRLIWGWVDSVTLEGGDIDHIVVTRGGGVLAIDTKWRSGTNPTDQASMSRSAVTASRRASGVVNSLLQRERGSHRSPGKAFEVRPVLVLWGAEQRQVPDGASIEGVPVIGGRRLVSWLATLDGQPVDEQAGRELLSRLADYRNDAWATTVLRK